MYTIYTDGSCLCPQGPGGYGAIVRNDDRVEFMDCFNGDEYYEIIGGAKETTSQRMEIMAAMMGVESTPKDACVEVYSDSTYVVNSFSKGWIYNWERANWYDDYKQKPRANADLWKRFLNLTRERAVTFHWVKAHTGNEFNEIADDLARERMMFYKELLRDE